MRAWEDIDPETRAEMRSAMVLHLAVKLGLARRHRAEQARIDRLARALAAARRLP